MGTIKGRTQCTIMRTYGYAWTTGMTCGFEFIDNNFWGGGWILHLFLFKILCFYEAPTDE